MARFLYATRFDGYPVTSTVSGCVTGSAMMILILGCVCGAHGADTALSAAGAGTVSPVDVPPQIAQHRATTAIAVPVRIMCFFIRLPPMFLVSNTYHRTIEIAREI